MTATILRTIPEATDISFLAGTGFNAFEVIAADLLFELGRTTCRATVMFDAPVDAWAHLDFTLESRIGWRRRRGIAEFTKFIAAIGLKSANDTDELQGCRAALHVDSDGATAFARLAS